MNTTDGTAVSKPSCPSGTDCSCEKANADASTYTAEYKQFLKMFAIGMLFIQACIAAKVTDLRPKHKWTHLKSAGDGCTGHGTPRKLLNGPTRRAWLLEYYRRKLMTGTGVAQIMMFRTS